MAGKDATVYIIDVGSTMKEISQARSVSQFDYAARYVWDKLTTTVATGRKTLLSGVIAVRSDETNNVMQGDPSYSNISVLCELKQVLMPDIRSLRQTLKPSSTDKGDVVSALVVAIQMISETCKKLAYLRRIILVTDARANMDVSDLSEVAKKIQEDNIELAIVGVDFDDPDFGLKEEDKAPIKAENEKILRQLCEDVGGIFGTVSQAVEELGMPRVKQVRPTPSYKGILTLGDSSQYDDALSISVERYPKVMVARPPTASKFVIRSDMHEDTQQEEDKHVLAGVTNARTYQVKDATAPGGKREVEFEDLAKGYEYGRTAVHISESDQNVTTFETPQGLDIIGFVDAGLYARYFDMSRTNVIIAEQRNNKAAMALSSLIHALYELESYAVARLVTKPNKNPSIVLLSPCIEPDLECLYDSELPFQEDIRMYRFPPLDKIVTVSGKAITVHRNLPNDELQNAMDHLVDAMDLSEAASGGEYAAMDDVYSPVLHHLTRMIQQRAIYPDAQPSEPEEILTRYSHPPEHVLKDSTDALKHVIAAADVKKVPPKARGKRFGRQEEKPLSDLDIGALLASDPKRKQKRIDTRNAIPEFKQLLSSASSVADISDACKQLQVIIKDWIRHSVGDSGYGKALEAIRVMREEMTELEEPAIYNDFLKELRSSVETDELGGSRKDLWWLLRVNRVGPINKRECTVSTIDEDETKSFMTLQKASS